MTQNGTVMITLYWKEITVRCVDKTACTLQMLKKECVYYTNLCIPSYALYSLLIHCEYKYYPTACHIQAAIYQTNIRNNIRINRRKGLLLTNQHCWQINSPIDTQCIF